jgi:Uncharacterized protein conserved in bacteria (DUF2252)
MNIREATQSYEAWMRKCNTIIEADLQTKHEQMKKDLFYFLRGTYYRWAQLFPDVCRALSGAPKVLACGDLHVGSFGTWRDSEGRLSWGVDDFDEAFPLAYANDLIRLATSVKILTDCEQLTIKLKRGCEAILEGYEQALRTGGRPIVLAEQEKYLQTLGMDAIKPSKDFWAKLNRLPGVSGTLPRNLKATLERTLPPRVAYKLVRRKAGMGSLGQPRFVAIAEWEGGCIAREAKALVPSSSMWVAGRTGSGQGYYEEAINGAIRSRDPFQRIMGGWLIRRLSPDSNPIEIIDLPRDRDEETLLHAMGSEAANVHLGSKKSVGNILKDLRKKKPNWLRSAAKDMAKAMEREWKKYKKL